jgi:tRNA dimethylallyltransferase
VIRGEMTRDEAVAACAQGHRNYAKRQLTWFRKDQQMQWLAAFGSDRESEAEARRLLALHLQASH